MTTTNKKVDFSSCKVEIISDEKISNDLESFLKKVSLDNRLCDWEVEFWNIVGENECIDDLKLIYLDKTPEDSEIKKWFLHEVAHALLPNDEDNRWHRKEWKLKCKELSNRHLLNYDLDDKCDPNLYSFQKT